MKNPFLRFDYTASFCSLGFSPLQLIFVLPCTWALSVYRKHISAVAFSFFSGQSGSHIHTSLYDVLLPYKIYSGYPFQFLSSIVASSFSFVLI
jgi:hypothetical protein